MSERDKKKALTQQVIENTLFQDSYNQRSNIILNAEYVEEPQIDPEDSEINLTTIQPQSTLAVLADSGAPLNWQPQNPNYHHQNSYDSRQQEINKALKDFGFF